MTRLQLSEYDNCDKCGKGTSDLWLSSEKNFSWICGNCKIEEDQREENLRKKKEKVFVFR